MKNASSALHVVSRKTELADPYESILTQYLGLWADAETAVCKQGGRRLPAETVASLRSSRVLAAPIPSSLGGPGADLLSTSRAVRRVAAVAPSTALAIVMPLGNAANARLTDDCVPAPFRASLATGRQFIADKALSGRILAVANSEPGGQGDLAQTRTRAQLGPDGTYRLSGRKSFATIGPDADYFLCAAQVEEGALDAFFVAREAEGVRLGGEWEGLGMRSSASIDLTLEQAPAAATFVYPGAILGTNARHWSTLLLGAVFLGIGEGALAAAVGCAPRGSSWVRATVADAALSLEAAAGYLDSVARADALPCSEHFAERCRRVKTFAARTTLDVTSRCMMIAGGRAYHPEHALARALVDAAAGPLLRPPLPQAMDAIAATVLDV